MFELTTTEREFPLDETVDVPRRIAEYKRGDRVLFVAITKAAFITTGPIGAEFIYLFEDGVPLGSALRTVCEKYGHDKEEQIRGILGDLLTQIETRQFFQHAKTSDSGGAHTMLARLTNRCNLRCTHCLVSSAPDWPADNELTFTQWCSVLDGYAEFVKQRLQANSRVTITGGEALVRRDALDIVRYSKSLGLSTELFSNGVLMSNNNAIVAAIAAAGVDEVQISLDGASAAVHDAIRGQGMFNRTARALCMLRDAGVKVRLAMVVMPQNYDDLLVNLVPLLRRLGDGFQVRLSLAVLQGRADRSMTFPSLEGEEKLRVLIKQVDGEGVRAPNPIVPNKRTITCGYAKELTVNSDGLVYGCGPQKFPIGDVRKESVLSIADRMSEKALKAEIDLVEGCRDCNIRYLCGGTCRLNNIERKGRAELSCCDQAEKDRKINLLFLRASDLVPLLAVPSAPTPISNEAKQQWASPGTSGVSSGFVPLSALT